jgi:hypothetical protein
MKSVERLMALVRTRRWRRIEGAEQGAPLGLAGCLDAQICAAPGPAISQVGMGAPLDLVEEEAIDRAPCGLPLQPLLPPTADGDRFGILAGLERMPWPTPGEPLRRSCIESQVLPIAGPPRRRLSARSRSNSAAVGQVQP